MMLRTLIIYALIFILYYIILYYITNKKYAWCT